MNGLMVIAVEEKYVAVFFKDSGHDSKIAGALLSRNEAMFLGVRSDCLSPSHSQRADIHLSMA
jgi:hypothetical protein